MANRVYLAFYKHKRSFLKEPFKALADAVTRFFYKRPILTLRDSC